MSDAWRSPTHDAREGDLCTINGAPGHLNNKLECIPDKRDAITITTPATDACEVAYHEYCDRLFNAWKNPLARWASTNGRRKREGCQLFN